MSDFDFEFKRQLIHGLVGTCIAVAVWYLKPTYGRIIVLPLLLAVAVFYAIPKIGVNLHIHNFLIEKYEREKDKATLPYRGSIYYALGVAPAVFALPVELACAVVMTLSVGDAVSTIVGVKYGRVQISDKTLEGFIAFILVGVPAAALFASVPQAFMLAGVGAFIELFSPWDDNLAIPWILTPLAFIL
ncbi:MAG: hypothetical protein GF334_03585 [Candidatus Altiarchaeales archaeon]|nr:hypothetical protein [Candidatus Altiarchaeales archaeon]